MSIYNTNYFHKPGLNLLICGGSGEEVMKYGYHLSYLPNVWRGSLKVNDRFPARTAFKR
ncbi:MAG: hypothetical protein CFH41_01382 [Alphaproteobacteria bacterium MarineAlpha11_Bin1]|nr:MAG: hypothetical protein CFH41_01382 [Alphaproteobacteria bacterium MarineAlpha11_Bin1]